MRRAVLVLTIVSGTAVPALFASAWLFGCCVLPFHSVMHRLLPLCRIATALHGAASQQQPATSPVEKQQRLGQRAVMPVAIHFFRATSQMPFPPFSAAAYRTFITLGAVRCDRDVGLHALLATFLI